MSKANSIKTGDRFGRLVVLTPCFGRNRHKAIQVECLCDCGKVKIVLAQNLLRGHTLSCGCYHRQLPSRYIHGLSTSPEYAIWQGIKARCFTPSATGYKNYGGKGITVCERWKDFTMFYEDMGPRPSPEHSIDRVDCGKGYSKDNCRWATRAQQANNTTTNRIITIDGVSRTASEWASEQGLRRQVIAGRLHAGWTEQRAVLTPLITDRRHTDESKRKMAERAMGRVWSEERRRLHGMAQKKRFAREREEQAMMSALQLHTIEVEADGY